MPGQGNGTGAGEDVAAGAAIYADECSACHYGNGGGEPRLFPSLSKGTSVHPGRPDRA